MSDKQKKKFKDTKVFSIFKDLGVGAFNAISPFPIKKVLDKNGDGKVDLNDLKEIRPMEAAGAVAIVAFLLYFEIISLENLTVLIKAFIGG